KKTTLAEPFGDAAVISTVPLGSAAPGLTTFSDFTPGSGVPAAIPAEDAAGSGDADVELAWGVSSAHPRVVARSSPAKPAARAAEIRIMTISFRFYGVTARSELAIVCLYLL